MNRRRFLHASAASGVVLATTSRRTPAATVPVAPVLDAHVHLFDPQRAGGIPWPPPDDTIYKPALPSRLQALAAPLGVVGAIAIEASPRPLDNDWLLDCVTRNPFMVGFVGSLVPGSPTFAPNLERLHHSPLFLGIRFGNLWGPDLANTAEHPPVLEDLHRLQQAGLTFESANPTPALLRALLAISTHLPQLRVVIDHLPHLLATATAPDRHASLELIAALAQAPNTFIKLSEFLSTQPGTPQSSALPYRDILDPLWDLFHPSRILFGSDWPNSDHVAPYAQTLAVAQDFVHRRNPGAAPAIFWQSSQRAYPWHPRTALQRHAFPSLHS